MTGFRHVTPYVVCLLGLTLVLCAGYRSWGLGQLVHDRPAGLVQSLNQGTDLDSVEIDQGIEAYRSAVATLPHMSDAFIQLGRLMLRRAIYLDGQLRDDALRAAAGYFEQAIAASPSEPFGWSLLALSQDQMASPEPQIISLIRYSHYLGPQEASSILIRVPVGLRHWDGMPADLQESLRQDMRRWWRYPALQPDMISLYLGSSLTERIIIRKAILTSPELQKKFDRLLIEDTGLKRRR
ncbi:MAG: hypothetical protein GC184_03830 [Rhizobiales bacterium]|nr:hypothetical protein [Hyphomicrobiales bacterium]